MNKVYNFLGGRHTFFALFFAIAGTALAAHGHLNGTYVALITALQTYVLVHSAKEDYFESKGVSSDTSGK